MANGSNQTRPRLARWRKNELGNSIGAASAASSFVLLHLRINGRTQRTHNNCLFIWRAPRRARVLRLFDSILYSPKSKCAIQYSSRRQPTGRDRSRCLPVARASRYLEACGRNTALTLCFGILYATYILSGVFEITIILKLKLHVFLFFIHTICSGNWCLLAHICISNIIYIYIHRQSTLTSISSRIVSRSAEILLVKYMD